jgi:uncharacterized Zn finger protein
MGIMKVMTLEEVQQLQVGDEIVVERETHQVQRVEVGTEYPDGDADVKVWTMDGGGPLTCFVSEIVAK